MVDIKMSLTILVPGARVMSKQECFKNSKIVAKNGSISYIEEPIEGKTEKFTFVVDETDPRTGHKHAVRKIGHIRGCYPAKQVINMSTMAYEAMTSADDCPAWFRVPDLKPFQLSKAWKKLSPEERLDLHMHRIAENFQGTVLTYQVFED